MRSRKKKKMELNDDGGDEEKGLKRRDEGKFGGKLFTCA